MILYTLTNASYKMDIYEDKVIFYPRWWKSATSKQWESALILPYAKVERIELHRKLWPMGHQLVFHTQGRSVVFKFRRLYAFFERLHVYLERQVIRYFNRPEGYPSPVKSVIDIVEERKLRKDVRHTPKNQAAA